MRVILVFNIEFLTWNFSNLTLLRAEKLQNINGYT